MATFYLDYEGGNDANDGLSFANRWKTFTNGATAARIAPGDTIRVMASPDPTLVGNATWTSGFRVAAANISSSTNATPIVITTFNPHGLVAGDYVSISGHGTNTNANGIWKVGTVGSTTTFQILQIDGSNTTGNGVGSGGNFLKATNCIVKLASPVTQNIALCGGLGQKPAWTASANVTCTQNTTAYKEGYSSASIAIAAAFTTGKAAYYTLPSTLDLSGYQQVSFWVQQTVGTIGAAGAVYIALCSDTLGATVVNTVNLPALGSLGTWHQYVVNLSGALGASIRSVAFYVVTDNGAQTFLIDNIIACKASSSNDSLSLTSLISKSDGTGDEAWYAIQSINYDAIMIANANTSNPNDNATSTAVRGYSGTTATVSTYKRETIKQTPLSASTSTGNAFNDSGTAGNLIAYSGGWNRTDMSTQTGETWYDGVNGNGYCYTPLSTTQSYNSIDKLNAVRFTQSWRFIGAQNFYNVVLSSRSTACTQGFLSTSYNTFTGPIWVNNNGGSGITLSGTSNGSIISTVKIASNNNGYGISFGSGAFNSVSTVDAANNNTSGGIDFSSGSYNTVGSIVSNGNLNTAFVVTSGVNNRVNGGSSASNVNGGVSLNGSGSVYLSNFTFNDTVEVQTATATLAGNVFSNRNDNTDNNNWVYNVYWTANQQTSVVDSPATTSWKINPTNALVTSVTPARLKLGTVVCAASSLVTVTARMRRDNTGLTMRLVCPGGQISGVANDVSSDMTASANTWETVTITFTPTKAGGVDIYAYAFGGTTYSGYVCNLTASQA